MVDLIDIGMHLWMVNIMQSSAKLIKYARDLLVRRTDTASVIRLFSLYQKSNQSVKEIINIRHMTLCKCLTHIKQPQAIRVDNGNERICNAMQYIHAEIKAKARKVPN